MSNDKKSNKNVSGLAAGITMAASVIPLVKPAIDAVKEYADKTIEERKKLIAVPELYSKEYPLTKEQAIELLDSCGLKVTLVKASISDASIQYRNCFDMQVIKSNPKAKQKVERGTSILVKYITQEVIDECQRMFDESEKRKTELSLEKSIKRSEQKEKTKQVISNISGIVKRGVTIPSVLHKNKSIEEEQDEKE